MQKLLTKNSDFVLNSNRLIQEICAKFKEIHSMHEYHIHHSGINGRAT